MDYMTRKIETCIYIQRQSRYHRVSTNVTRLARLSAKSNVYLVAMRHAVSGWHLKTQPTHIHISYYYSSPAKHKSTTTSSHNSTAEFRYSITHIESFQNRSSSHTNKAPPAKSDLSLAHSTRRPSLFQYHTGTPTLNTYTTTPCPPCPLPLHKAQKPPPRPAAM